MKPKISIIVPVYNTEKYLNRCINSILNQSFKELELILVNDGSTDNSRKILDKYFKKDSRIKVINKENGGQGSARNMGLDIAQGEYIGFVDSDDWIHKDMYKCMYDIAIKNEVSIVQVNHEITNSFFYDNCFEVSKINVTKIDDVIKRLTECNSFEILPFIFPVNKIYHRSIWNNLRYPEGKFAEDLRIIHKIYEKAKKIVCLDYKFYYYYMSKNSSTRSGFKIKKLEDIEAWEELLQFYRNNYPKINVNNLRMIYCRRIMNYYFECKGYKEIQNNLKKKFNNNFKYILRSKKLNYKEKLVYVSFYINPKICRSILKV